MTTKLTLPPRKWYSLQQAAELLSREFNQPVTVDDLIHYAYIGILELCIRVEYNDFIGLRVNKKPIELNTIDNFDMLLFNEDFNIETSEKLSYISDYSTFHIRLPDDRTKTIEYTETQNGKEFIVKKFINQYFFRMEGFFSFNLDYYKIINTFINEDILNNGININNIVLEIPRANKIKKKYFIKIRAIKEPLINIKLEDIYILDKELELLKNGGLKLEERAIEKLTNFTTQEIQPRSNKLNNQTEFIKSLLKLHYNIDTPEQARTALNNGKLGRDFAKKGIDAKITGETLRNWLKQEF